MPAGRPGAILGTATLMGILTGFQPIGRCMVLVIVPAGGSPDLFVSCGAATAGPLRARWTA